MIVALLQFERFVLKEILEGEPIIRKDLAGHWHAAPNGSHALSVLHASGAVFEYLAV